MIYLIGLVIGFILALVGLVLFTRATENTTYDLRTFKFGLFLYFVVLIFDFANELALKYPSIYESLKSMQLPTEYLILASKLVLIPLFALLMLIGLFKIYQESEEDSFKAQIEKL